MIFLPYLALLASGLALLSQAVQAVQAVHLADRDSAGCGKAKDFAGETRFFNINSNGVNRNYAVSLPDDYKADEQKPMIVTYHGRGQTPTLIKQNTAFFTPGVDPGWVVIYPAGLNKSWEGPSYAVPGVDDLQFTTDLVNHMVSEFCIDVSRIYAAGFSNGGGFINYLACSAEHGAPFAAFAGVSAALYTDNEDNDCNPSRSPLPMFEAHGTNDKTIPYEGWDEAAGGVVPPIPQWLNRWYKRNDCTPKESYDIGKGVTESIWACGGKEDQLHHLKMDGHSHAYPDKDDEQIFVSPKIIDFFKTKKHPSP